MRGSAHGGYLLSLLTAILVFNFVDRLALGIVLQDIKTELQLSDTELGFLGGIAFAFFYSVMGVPIARWADRGNRVAIISVTAALWSVAVAACGLAASFVQLLLVRVAVAVGEAGAFPPALSLISDNFTRPDRPRAVAIYTLAWPLSCVIGYFLAGWLNQIYGWRATFMVLGAPGLVLAAIAWLTLEEPRQAESRRSSDTVARPAHHREPNLKQVCAILWTNATFRSLLLCISVQYFFAYGILQWQPTFFIRSFDLTSAQVGAGFAITYGVGGLCGTYLGGQLASRYARHNEHVQLLATAIAWLAAGVLSFLAYLSSSPYWAFGLIGLAIFAQTASSGPLFGTMQTLVPESMRAVSVALVLLFANLIGMGFGPLAAGALSDATRAWVGEESLRYALLILAPGYLWVGWFAWRASRTVAGDLASTGTSNKELMDIGSVSATQRS